MSFPEQLFGFVAGRWVRSIGDTPDDPDRAPDYVPVETGKVVFTPQVTHRVAADGSGWAGIIKDRVLGGVGERGQLIDAEGHDHLALATGVYSVSYDFGSGWSWPSHYIEVKPEHTVDAPLWLPPIAPPAKGPLIENRVVTIPADGEDGQVLVWDGGGFSWADPPKGDKGDDGDPGEVTTEALTTALAGKVTGQGMSVRVDNSVGTRVFLDHPGGSTMLYGDTGWRDIRGLLIYGWTADALLIRRTTHEVTLRALNLDGTAATADWVARGLPIGLLPEPTLTAVSTASMDSVSRLLYLRPGGTDFSLLRGAKYGALTTHLEARWTPRQSWPTTLPGLPG